MAFFSSMKDSIKTSTETAGIKVQMRNNEKMLDKMIYQVGLKYVNLHETDYEPEFEEFMKEIRRLQKANRVNEEQLTMLSLVKVCPCCGAGNRADMQFCGECGASLFEVEAVQRRPEKNTYYCPHCGALNQAGAVFCEECGGKIEQDNWE